MPVFEIGLDDGRKLRIDAADQEAALAGAQHFTSGGAAPEDKPSGSLAGFRKGISDLVHGPAETLKQYGGVDTSGAEKVAETLAPKDYKSAPIVPENGHWYDPTSYNWKNVPQNLAEAAPGMAQDLGIARTVGMIHPALGLAAGAASYMLRSRGDAAKHDAVVRTGDPNAEPILEDKARAFATGIPEAALGAVNLGRLMPASAIAGKVSTVGSRGLVDTGAKYATTIGTGAGVGAAQNAIGQAGATIGTPGGLQVDPNQVVSAGVVGGAANAGLGAKSAASDALTSIKLRNFNTPEARAFANRINDAADGANLKDPSVGGEAYKTASDAVKSELKDVVGDVSSRVELHPDVKNALDRASQGRALSETDVSRIKDSVAGDQSAAKLLDLVGQSNHAAELASQGTISADGKFSGGISGIRHHLTVDNAIKTAMVAALGSHAGHLISYSPEMLGLLGAGMLGTHVINKVTGARSPAARFAERLGDGTTPVRVGTPAPAVSPTGPSVGPTGPRIAPTPQPWGSEPPPEQPVAPGVDPKQLIAQMNQLATFRKAAADNAAKEENLRRRSLVDESMPLLRTLSQQNQAQPTADPAAAQKQQIQDAVALMNARRANARLSPEPPDVTGQYYAADQANAAYDRRATREQSQDASAMMAARRANAQLEEQNAPEAPAAPAPAPAPFDPLAMPRDVTSRAKTLMAGLRAREKMQGAQPEPDQAGPTFSVRPLGPTVDDGGPVFGLKPQPAPIVVAKIMKKANGKVTEKPAAPQAAPEAPQGAFTPLTDLPRKNLMDHEVVDRELADYEPRLKKAYGKKIIEQRGNKRDAAEGLAEVHGSDGKVLKALYHELDERHTRLEASMAVEHYANQMTPEGAAATRAKFTPEFISANWKN